MNLSRMLAKRAEEGRPVRVGIIGAGKFGAMYLSQARLTKGTHILGIADLDVPRAKDQLRHIEWEAERYAASSFDDALKHGTTFVTDNAEALIKADGLEVLIDATGDPAIGIKHCLMAIDHGRHIVMVNVEADVVAGPLLAARAEAAGLVYTLAWGDQPALISEHVDWARSIGFKVVCAGKGTRYLPRHHASTPDTVWENFGFDLEMVKRGRLNPKMFNSFIDGTKSGIEMSAVCNATGLRPQADGLHFPPSSRLELAEVCKPKSAGGQVDFDGTTEVVSSLYRDGTDVPVNLQFGTYVVVEAETDYATYCFEEYKMLHDSSFKYAALYRPTHMIGLELGVSVASAALRNEPTGSPIGFFSDVVATAKRDLKAGETLDGEGGYCVWGKQTPADASLENGYLPLGLAHNVRLKRDVKLGERLAWADVDVDETSQIFKVRREMEARFGRPNARAAE
ncbi:flagellar biosynthesis protein FlgA [Thalassobaculum sp.]|uniref:NAD(P)H-dependent oxidoreductase n=1 Tax=Thalassobaculum sp. TaxID=2022740 RepID=UPI0032EB3986